MLDEGRVLDVGRHDELYARCDLYRDLCDRQMQPATEVGDEGSAATGCAP